MPDKPDITIVSNNQLLFGERSVVTVERQIVELLSIWQDKINATLKKMESGELAVTFTVSLARYGKSVNVQTGIAFVSEKVKDKVESSTVNEDQGELFDGNGRAGALEN